MWQISEIVHGPRIIDPMILTENSHSKEPVSWGGGGGGGGGCRRLSVGGEQGIGEILITPPPRYKFEVISRNLGIGSCPSILSLSAQ
jgi:hypothetical protein